MALDDITEHLPPPPARRPPWLERVNGKRAKGFLAGLESRFEKMGTLQTVLVAAGGVLVIEHLIAPKGMSVISKTWDKISGAPKALPPPPPVVPPPLVPAVVPPKVGYHAGFDAPEQQLPYGWPMQFTGAEAEAEAAEAEAAAHSAHLPYGFPMQFTGANLQAGWNRGMSPYGPWAVADPMAQYAHAAQRQRTGHHRYGWE
jgi:hypothetical protein